MVWFGRDYKLEPEILEIESRAGLMYGECRTIVKLSVNDGFGGRRETRVAFPINDGRNLVNLMKFFPANLNIPHEDMIEMSKVIREALGT